MTRHECQSSLCGVSWYTCNDECLKKKGGGKRNFNTSYPSSKSAKRHHTQCHKMLAPSSLGAFAPTEVVLEPDTHVELMSVMGHPALVDGDFHLFDFPNPDPPSQTQEGDSSHAVTPLLLPHLISDNESYIEYPTLADGDVLI
jgi:hypothetical protein